MKRIRRYLITGLMILLPTVISLYILVFVFQLFDSILGNVINQHVQKMLGFYIPGIGLVLFFALILLVGFLSSFFAEKLLQRYLDRFVSRFPLLRNIYPPIRQIFEFLFSKENLSFKRSVLVEFPVKGSWTLGFVTNESFQEANDKAGAQLLNIYIPLAPNPSTGFIVFVPRDSVKYLDIDVKDAMRLVVSGGLLNPPRPAKDTSSEPKA